MRLTWAGYLYGKWPGEQSAYPELAKATIKFIATYFEDVTHETTNEGMQKHAVNIYRLKGSDIELTQPQMFVLFEILNQYGYDGNLHAAHHELRSGLESLGRTARDFGEALLKNSPYYPRAFGYQVMNLLEVTAWLTAMWEWFPDYSPGADIFIPLGILALGVMRNNHYYASSIVTLSPQEIETMRKKITEVLEEIKEQLIFEGLPLSEEQRDQLLEVLTSPSSGERLLNEACSWASYLVKLGASFAVLSAEFKEVLPWWAVILSAVLAGSIEGFDTAFTKVLAIGAGEHGSLMKWQDGIIPPSTVKSCAPGFSAVADFGPIPWFMAKVGPIAWPIVKVEAAIKLLTLIGLDPGSVRGGLYGYYGLAIVSSSVFSYVFTRYNIDRKLAKELPTKRAFTYLAWGDRTESALSKVGSAIVGALPASTVVAYLLHRFGQVNYPITAAVAISMDLLIATLLSGEWPYRGLFAQNYQKIFEMRLVARLIGNHDNGFKFRRLERHTIDKLPIRGKLGLFTVGAASTALGLGLDSSLLTAVGEVITFLTGTALIAEKSHSMANAIRFTVIQMLFYAPALLEWVLNCVFPLMNLAEGHDIADRPDTIDSSYFGVGGYGILVSLSLLLGVGAGYADWRSMGSKLSELTDRKPMAQNSLWEAAGYQENEDESESSDIEYQQVNGTS